MNEKDSLDALITHIHTKLNALPNAEQRITATQHLFGVAQCCALLALKRGVDAHVSTMAGLMHDLYSYVYDDEEDHAKKGAIYAREMLTEHSLASPAQIQQIESAIAHHSDKDAVHGALDEVLKDGDTLQHCLYNIHAEIKPKHKQRMSQMQRELDLRGFS